MSFTECQVTFVCSVLWLHNFRLKPVLCLISAFTYLLLSSRALFRLCTLKVTAGGGIIRHELQSCAHFRAFIVILLWQSGSSTASPQADACTRSSTSASTATKTEQKKLLSKDSILSLYASSPVGNPNQQQPAAGQGDTHTHVQHLR